MTKVAIIGANGQLGSALSIELNRKFMDCTNLTHNDIEISDLDLSVSILSTIKPDVIINTAAFHNVEACEGNPLKSHEINAIGALNLAKATSHIGAYLINFSTDYVFDGQKRTPYHEYDKAIPLNAYGNSKLSGENYILSSDCDAAVVRISGVYGEFPCRAKSGLNFVQLMIKLAKEKDQLRVVDNEILTPTSATAIAEQTYLLIKERAQGIFHSTADGECSWYEFASEILRYIHAEHKVAVADPVEFPSKVRRPAYSVLQNRNLQNLGINIMPNWKTDLARYLKTVL